MILKSCICTFLINLSAITDFPSLCVEHISILLSCNHFLKELLKNLLPLSTHILLGFLLDSFKTL